jgi:hypothetical protein
MKVVPSYDPYGRVDTFVMLAKVQRNFMLCDKCNCYVIPRVHGNFAALYACPVCEEEDIYYIENH